MKYFKNDVKRRDSTESKMNLKNLSKKCLTIYHESDKITKLSAAKAEAQDLKNFDNIRKNFVTEPIF